MHGKSHNCRMNMYCKSGTVVESTTTHSVDYEGNIIIIKNVPCLECDQCGEKYYTGTVAGKIEKIVERTKSLNLKMTVIDYTFT